MFPTLQLYYDPSLMEILLPIRIYPVVFVYSFLSCGFLFFWYITLQISDGNCSFDIMQIINSNTQALKDNISSVIKVLDGNVDLFLEQFGYGNSSIETFYNFSVLYSQTFSNIARNTTAWSALQVKFFLTRIIIFNLVHIFGFKLSVTHIPTY